MWRSRKVYQTTIRLINIENMFFAIRQANYFRRDGCIDIFLLVNKRESGELTGNDILTQQRLLHFL